MTYYPSGINKYFPYKDSKHITAKEYERVQANIEAWDGSDGTRPEIQYDYDNQAWIKDGKYEDCGHPATQDCTCYGRKHAGKRAPNIH